ncbi:MAG TPA: IS1595 family transposase [Allosphingosinicella sp.]|nr:IS1595 family transposase [Allosphingosinicella sp.]
MTVNITDPIFHNEAAAQAHAEASRWGGEPTCPYCGSLRIARLKGESQTVYFLCNDCRDKFTVRTCSVMERSHVPLHKWLLAFHLLAASKKGMSAKQMERMLGVTYKTAWFLCHRVREAMDGADAGGPLGGPGAIVEADETFVGGKARNRAHRSPAPKKAVIALVERDGRARSFHVANITGKNVRSLIFTNVSRDSTLMTDMGAAFKMAGMDYPLHHTVNHSIKQFVRVDRRLHSNTAENFFSIFKRGVIGTYHHMSEAHLGRYCREFDMRYNTREMTDGERADLILKGGIGRRLTYRRTDALAA